MTEIGPVDSVTAVGSEGWKVALVASAWLVGCDKVSALIKGAADASSDGVATSDSVDAGTPPVALEILSITSPPSLTQQSFRYGGGTSTISPKDGFKFIVVETRVTVTPCTDKMETDTNKRGLVVSTGQAVLRLPDGRRLSAEGGGSDYDRMCIGGCITSSQKACDGPSGTEHFWFVFIGDAKLDAEEDTTLEFRRIATSMRKRRDGGA